MKTPEEYGREAREKFLSGYTCSQAVLGTFAEALGFDLKTAMLIASPFGGGLGRQREVCGAVSGMCMALGLAEGFGDPPEAKEKGDLYRKVQTLCASFRERFGTINCGEMLRAASLKPETDPNPEKRTAEYYNKRPCPDIIEEAARIFAAYAIENGLLEGDSENA